jgi:hypothetical protein
VERNIVTETPPRVDDIVLMRVAERMLAASATSSITSEQEARLVLTEFLRTYAGSGDSVLDVLDADPGTVNDRLLALLLADPLTKSWTREAIEHPGADEQLAGDYFEQALIALSVIAAWLQLRLHFKITFKTTRFTLEVDVDKKADGKSAAQLAHTLAKTVLAPGLSGDEGGSEG